MSTSNQNKMDQGCPLCQKTGQLYAKAQDIEYFTSNDIFQYYVCDSCHLIYISPAPEDRLSEIYPANYYSFSDTSSKNFISRVKESMDIRAFRGLLAQIPGESLKVLDIGGGTGWLSGLVRKCDTRITQTQIVDLDVNASIIAEKAGHRFFCGRIEDFQTTERYDLVLVLNLIEHVRDPLALLKKIKELLAPGGRVYIKTPNFRSLDAWLFRHLSWGGYHCPRHFVIFDKKGFEKLVEKSGLVVREFHYTQGAPFWSISILDLLRRFGLVKISASRPAIYHPLIPLLQMIAAGFDFARRPFSKLSQFVSVLSLKDK